MANGAMIALAAFHLESDFLFTAFVGDDVGDDGGARNGGRTQSELAITADEEDPFKSEGLPGVGGQAFDFERIARGDTILFTASFQYSVHKVFPLKGRLNKQ